MRLLSYNIHKGIGVSDRRYRLERVIEVIEEQNPDLICLQEVTRHARRTSGDDQPQRLSDYFKLPVHLFQMNVHYKRGGGYGNLLLSRWPLHGKHLISLRHQRRKARGVQLAVIETPEGLLHLANWHLGLAEQERHWQVQHLLEHHLFRECCHLPTLIVGDFNDWRNTLAQGPFARHEFRHATTPQSHFRSFPAFMAMLALDKVFYRGGLHIKHVRVVHNRMARRASDHLPVVVDFHLGDGKA
ncbi:MAG TPA: endonuclease/exonuclease/phosphatase family protein [Gemmataceae bacterium]|nr:endonuclease/exonuclease/phosphatase family protein [Gemmataceae bacterium]